MIALQDARGDRDVVEDAVAFAAIGERMMRAAGQVGGDAVVERGARRGDRRADRSPRALDHLRRPRKADAPLDLRAQRAVGDGVDVVGDRERAAGRRATRAALREDPRATTMPSARMRSRSREYFAIGNLWPSGSGSTKWSE